MTSPLTPHAAAILLAAVLFSGCRSDPKAEPFTLVPLSAGSRVTARLGVGGLNSFSLAVSKGRSLHLRVEQKGVDVVLSLNSSKGLKLLELDSPNRSWGREELWWIAPEDGVLRLDVRPFKHTSPGTYSLQIVSIGVPQLDDDLRVEARALIERAEHARKSGDVLQAKIDLSEARRLWQRSREPLQEALTSLLLADTAEALGDFAFQVSSYREAIELFRKLGDFRQECYTYLSLGEALRHVEDLNGAQKAQVSALQLAESHRLLEDQAAALNNLALIYEGRGEIRAALGFYRRALVLIRRLGDRDQAATVLHNAGVCESRLGSLDSAESNLSEALALRRALGEVREEGSTLTEIGWIYRLRGLSGGGNMLRERSKAFLEQALACRRAAGDANGEAGTLDRLGSVLRDEGRWDEALSVYQQSLALSAKARSERGIAYTLTNLAELRLEQGDLQRANRLAEKAVAHLVKLPNRDTEAEAHAHFLLGRAASGLGDLIRARREFESSLGAMEKLRARLGDESLTLPFFALRQLYFEVALETLMDLEGRHPGEGFAAAALLTSERAHMRTLIDGIAERQRRDSGGGAGFDPKPLTMGDIESELLDEETLLLEFALGEERSFLFVLSREGLVAYTLPGRRVLEPLVQQVHRSLARSQASPEYLSRLADILLGHLIDRQEVKRLVIVTDGSLAYIPFAALPWGSGARPLLERFELVQLPSAATLLALRRRQSATPQVPGPTAAVLADPVFSALDSRVVLRSQTSVTRDPSDRADLTRSVHDLGISNLPRLAATRNEADAIASLAPRSLVLVNFAANKSAMDSTRVRNARRLHLATHSLVHPTDPALSGIVLSLVDGQGRPQAGFLSASYIAGLNLHARLVVLSSCKTAIGPEIRGEGLMGLARAFMHAGANTVVASLWNVKDRVTAELMERFYVALIRDRLPPAAALRRAQLELSADPRTASASYWAGFELLGDWR